MQRGNIFGYILFGVALHGAVAYAQGVDVTAQVLVQRPAQGKATTAKPNANSADVAVWLVPMQPGATRPDTGHPGPYRLIQKNKQFIPHLLVVPTGASIDFPNEDPFFHNVFSLFNGKRFDLGLYESGASRSVRFDREGVSYIFCNIHAEMSAVVISLTTPLYGQADAQDVFHIHDVPEHSPGDGRHRACAQHSVLWCFKRDRRGCDSQRAAGRVPVACVERNQSVSKPRRCAEDRTDRLNASSPGADCASGYCQSDGASQE